jgi:hypothetical protein
MMGFLRTRIMTDPGVSASGNVGLTLNPLSRALHKD